jgi:hypothetical protein
LLAAFAFIFSAFYVTFSWYFQATSLYVHFLIKQLRSGGCEKLGISSKLCFVLGCPAVSNMAEGFTDEQVAKLQEMARHVLKTRKEREELERLNKLTETALEAEKMALAARKVSSVEVK